MSSRRLQQVQDEALPPSPSKAPEKKKKKGKNNNNNPYSSRGLDKFCSVLSELEEKKEKIMAIAGSKGVSSVRFTYSGENDKWVPILIKSRSDDDKQPPPPSSTAEMINSKPSSDQATPSAAAAAAAPVPASLRDEMIKKNNNLAARGERWRWNPAYFMPAVAVAVLLVSLVLFGRIFAICCTSIGWYLAPILQRSRREYYSGGGDRRSVRKEELGRRASDKKLDDDDHGGGGFVRSAAHLPPLPPKK